VFAVSEAAVAFRADSGEPSFGTPRPKPCGENVSVEVPQSSEPPLRPLCPSSLSADAYSSSSVVLLLKLMAPKRSSVGVISGSISPRGCVLPVSV